MDNLEFHKGGFPLETQTLEFMQSQTAMITALASLGGSDTYILSGVQPNGLEITDGFVVLKGEILPFKGGVLQNSVTLIVEVEKVRYEADDDNDGQGDQKAAYTKRYLRFGDDGTETFLFSSLNPFIEGIAGQMFKTFFKDIRLPYIGAIADIPKGWELCEILSGHFPAIYDRNNPDYNEILKTGGEDKVTLTEQQMPSHSHSGSTNNSGAHSHSGSTSTNGAHGHSGSTNGAGAHSHTGSTYASGNHRHRTAVQLYNENGHPLATASGDTASGNKRGYEGASSWYSDYAGSHSHTLRINNAGSHSHSVSINNAGNHNHSVSINNAGNHTHSVTTENKGGSQPHENRPLYKVMALIKYVG